MNVVKNIDLVNQKDDLSCTIACVAMLSGYSFDYVRKIAKHNDLKARGRLTAQRIAARG